MIRSLSSIVPAILLALLPRSGSAGLDSPAAAATSVDVVSGASEFSISLYKEMAGGEGNLIVSPLSVVFATAMLGAGAEGQTRAEISAATHLDLADPRTHESLRTLRDELVARVTQWAEISFVNGVWIDPACSPGASLVDLLARSYDAKPRPVSFGKDPESACALINGFVSEKTRGRIPTILTPDLLSADTRLVLANTIYLLAAWEHMFAEGATTKEKFHLAGGRDVPVDMMHRSAKALYCADDLAQVLELSYQGSGLALVFCLPAASRTLAEAEAALSPELLSTWIGGLKEAQIDISIPRFDVSTQTNLVPLLQRLGISRAFAAKGAEFPGLCRDAGVFVDLAQHSARIGVNEKGTEAAAATVYKMTLGIESPGDGTVRFRADHPFLFILRDTKTGVVLFMGRVANPSA